MASHAQAVRGITVWDGVSDLGPTNLTWAGDRIDETTPAPSDRHTELSVIPGLIDTYVHLTGPAVFDETGPANLARADRAWSVSTSREEQVLHVVANARHAMRRGVTTMRDMAGDARQLAVRTAFETGLLTGPRLFVYGTVGMTGGAADPALPSTLEIDLPAADGPHECRKLVRTFARDGMDGIKITTSGGGGLGTGRNAWRNYTLSEIRAIIDEAHALDLPVAAHAHTEAGIEAALVEGVDSLGYGTRITPEQADLAAERGLTVAPTLLVNDWLAKGASSATTDQRLRARELVAERDKRLRMAREAGVSFVLGSGSNGREVPYGASLAELGRHRDVLGFTDAKALASGTSEAAEAIGQGATLGRVAPGYTADFVVVRGRPWKNISQLRDENIVAVVCRGQLVAGSLPI